MKRALGILKAFLLILLLSSFNSDKEVTFNLTIEVIELRNSDGTVQFALYNRADAFPDEHYKKYLKKLSGKIINGSSLVTFENLPEGKYAINILHDENTDGKIKRGLILPKEGIGFSNYESLGFSNRPSFNRASFNLSGDLKISVKVIYLSNTL
jgi:uncharacterized protein (DUF2141 family)